MYHYKILGAEKNLMIYKRTEESEKILKQIYNCIDKNDSIAKKEQLVELGIDYRRILDFVENGEIIRIKNGYYTYEMERFSEDALVSKMFPDGVLCMESALYAYGYISERPVEFHIAIDKNTSKSRFKLDYPKVIPYYTEPEVLKIGVKDIQFENCHFLIYDKDRLICDCLKYESKMERKVFQHTLQAYINDKEKNIEALMEYAKERKVVKKVESVILVWLDEELVKKEKKSTKKSSISKNKKNSLSSVKEYSVEVEEKIVEEIVEVIVGENNTLAEDIFEIMKGLEQISTMACYDRVNKLLKTKVVNGLHTYQDLKELKETQSQIVTIEQLNQITDYKQNEFMKKRWKNYSDLYCNENDGWEKIVERLLAFIGPIWKSLSKEEMFFDEWMPELERFL